MLVTGGFGFIGSNLIRMWRTEHPDDVILAVDADTYAADPANLADVQGIDACKLDIGNRTAVHHLIQSFKPDGIINAAAETRAHMIAHKKSLLTTNLKGTINLIDAARDFWSNRDVPGRFLQVSMVDLDNCHKDCTSSLTYYGSKAKAESVAILHHKIYGMDVVITKGAKTYGPNAYWGDLVPSVVAACLRGAPVTVWGNLPRLRDWIYVEDHCWGIMQAYELGAPGGVYQLVGGVLRSKVEIVTMVLAILDRLLIESDYLHFMRNNICPVLPKMCYSGPVVDPMPLPDDVVPAGFERALEEWGWFPETPLEIGLEQTVRWCLDECMLYTVANSSSH